MINEEHSHQIQQEQERDFKRAEVELASTLDDLENRHAWNKNPALRSDLKRVRELIKMLGVNI